MTVEKRLLRKPLTTVLWTLLCAFMSTVLLSGFLMWFSVNRMMTETDRNHTAIGARIDPPIGAGEENRQFTKADAAWFSSLDSVKAVRTHTVSAASAKDFHPVVELFRHQHYIGNGDRRPYCNIALIGTVNECYADIGYLYLEIRPEEILLMNDEYVSIQVAQLLVYQGRLQVHGEPEDEACVSFFKSGERYVFSGYLDTEEGGLLLRLGGLKEADGILMGGYQDNLRTGEPPCEDTVYAFPAAEHLTDSPENFFETTSHEIWRAFFRSWEMQQHSLPVIGTDRVESMYSFLSHRASIVSGRTFSEGEYQNGERVMLVSQQIAERGELKVGDTVTLNQYTGTFESTGCYRENRLFAPVTAVANEKKIPGAHMNNPTVDLLRIDREYGPDETFTVVGIYSLSENWSDGSYDFSPNTVIIPKKAQIAGAAGELQETGDLYGVPLSIELVNGKADEFMAAVEASPYRGTFYVYDQGYEAVRQGLNDTAEAVGELFWFSLAGWIIFMILFLSICQGSEKKNLGTMRSLGVTAREAVAYLLGGGLCINGAGTFLGMIGSTIVMKHMQAEILAEALDQLDPALKGTALVQAEEEVRAMVSAGNVSFLLILLFSVCMIALSALLMGLQGRLLLRKAPKELMEG